MKKKIGYVIIGIGLVLLLSALIIIITGNSNSKFGYKRIYGKDFNNDSYELLESHKLVNNYLYTASDDGYLVTRYTYPNNVLVTSISNLNVIQSSSSLQVTTDVCDSYENFIEDKYNEYKDYSSISVYKGKYGSINFALFKYIDSEDIYRDELIIFVPSGSSYGIIDYLTTDKKLSDTLIANLINNIFFKKLESLNNDCSNDVCSFDISRLKYRYSKLSFKYNTKTYERVDILTRNNYSKYFSTKKDDNVDVYVELMYDSYKPLSANEVFQVYDNSVFDTVTVDGIEYDRMSYTDGDKNKRYFKEYATNIDKNLVVLIKVASDDINTVDDIIKSFSDFKFVK